MAPSWTVKQTQAMCTMLLAIAWTRILGILADVQFKFNQVTRKHKVVFEYTILVTKNTKTSSKNIDQVICLIQSVLRLFKNVETIY